MKGIKILLLSLVSTLALASGNGATVEVVKGYAQDLVINHSSCIMKDDGDYTSSQVQRLNEFGYELQANPSGIYLDIQYSGSQDVSRSVNGKQTTIQQNTYTLYNVVGLSDLGGIKVSITEGVGRVTSKEGVEDASAKIFDALIDTLPECAVN